MSNVQCAGWDWSLLDSLIIFWVLNFRVWESFGLVGSVRGVKIGFRFWLLFLGVWEIYKFMGRGCPIFNCCHLGSLIRMWRDLVKLGLWGELGQSSIFRSFCWNLRILEVDGSRMSNVYSAGWNLGSFNRNFQLDNFGIITHLGLWAAGGYRIHLTVYKIGLWTEQSNSIWNTYKFSPSW